MLDQVQGRVIGSGFLLMQFPVFPVETGISSICAV
jgi:hypothetical protein